MTNVFHNVDPGPAPPRPRGHRRAVAMLLALVAVASASILAATYVASRDNAGAIGLNAQAASDAHWASQSGADLAVAILQTQAAWIDGDPETLLSNFEVAGAKVEVEVTNLEGEAPDEDDYDLVVTITATAGGAQTVTQRVIKRTPPLDVDTSIDPAMGEFALYAKGKLTIDSGAIVGPWVISDKYVFGKKNKIGAGFTSDSDLSLGTTPLFVFAQFFANAAATSALKGKTADARFSAGQVLPIDVPAVAECVPAALTSLSVAAATDRTYATFLGNASPNGGRYMKVTVKDGAVVTYGTGAVKDYSIEELNIDNDGILRISGDVRLYIRGDMNLTNEAAIELASASSMLTVYVADDVKVDDSVVGFAQSIAENGSRVRNDITQYRAANRIKIYGLSTSGGGVSNQTYELKGRSLTNATIHAPLAKLDIYETSTLFGRLSAYEVRIHNGSALLYDPALDNEQGFTNIAGPLYTKDGAPIPGLPEALAKVNALGGAGLFVTTMKTNLNVVDVEPFDPEAAVTPRNAQLAKDTNWPNVALAMETAGGVSLASGLLVVTEHVGSVAVVAQGDDDEEDDDGLLEDLGDIIEPVLGGLGIK